jgi:hypothetical protein
MQYYLFFKWLLEGDWRCILRVYFPQWEFARRRLGGHWELWKVNFTDKPLWDNPRKCHKIEPNRSCLNKVKLIKCEDYIY